MRVSRRVTWTLSRLGLEAGKRTEPIVSGHSRIGKAVANSKVGGHKFRGISGGERRRTAVGVSSSGHHYHYPWNSAHDKRLCSQSGQHFVMSQLRDLIKVELAVARGVLALDEPTSGRAPKMVAKSSSGKPSHRGLDSSSALALGSLLAELASEGGRVS